MYPNSIPDFIQNKTLEGAVFLDCGTDLGSGHLVPGELPYFLLQKHALFRESCSQFFEFSI